MNLRIYVVLIGAIANFGIVDSKMFALQAVNPRALRNHEIWDIPTSSSGRSVIVKTGETFSINFCMRIKTSVKLTNLRFSRGNHSALFSVNLDHGKWMGTYYAPPGEDYGEFMDTGEFPNEYEFDSGWHVLKINISDSSSPIAVDFIEFNITDERMTPDILSCEIICIPTAHFPAKEPETTRVVSSATMRQESKPTQCSEIDNVDIPLYHPNIQKFSITSTLPKYKSFSNRRDFNHSNCPHLSPELWRFNSFMIAEQPHQMSSKDAYLLTAPGNGNRANSMLLVAIFRLEGQSKGSIDSKIGSELYLKFKSLPNKVDVSLKYRGDSSRLVQIDSRTYNGTFLEHEWKIPDFTWSETADNYVIFTIESEVRINFEVDNVRLVKRPHASGDYQDHLSEWWRHHRGGSCGNVVVSTWLYDRSSVKRRSHRKSGILEILPSDSMEWRVCASFRFIPWRKYPTITGSTRRFRLDTFWDVGYCWPDFVQLGSPIFIYWWSKYWSRKMGDETTLQGRWVS